MFGCSHQLGGFKNNASHRDLWVVSSYTRGLTSQQLFDLPAGLRGGELVNDVQGSLTQSVSHACTDTALE